MTKNTVALLALILSAGLVHAQDFSSSSDLTKMASDAASKPGTSSGSVALKDPVAVVNGDKISKAELEKNFSDALSANGVPVSKLTADQKLRGYNEILDGMIVEKLVDKAAADIKISKDEIAAQLTKIKSQFPSEDVFESEMKKSGLTMDQFKKNLEKSIRENKWMQQQVAGKDTVTDADAKAFYDGNPKDFAHPELVKVSHILFLVPAGATPDQDKAAEKKAEDAIARAAKGESFDALATELTEEPGGKQRAGALPPFSKGQMVPEFEAAAFSQKVGSVSETPVKTKFGYHVIKVTEKKAAGTATFDEAKPQIVAFLQAQKRRQIFKGVIADLRQSAKIEDYLPTPPPMPASAGMPAGAMPTGAVPAGAGN